MVYLSIIIPAYNSEKTIVNLLKSIKDSEGIDLKEIEVMIVDDASSDNTVNRGSEWGIKLFGRRLGNFRIIKLKENSGPASARNTGVKYAKGKTVLFLDADVVLHKETLNEIILSFKKDQDLFALTGVWDKKQKSNNFFPKFKALRDWSYWINERDPKNYYYLFSTRIAAINRKLFLRLKGFDTTYKAALIEDIELTYRIAKRYAVVFNPKARVFHEFEDFWPIAKKYFLRSFYWSKLYRERKKFDPVATTSKEALTTISAGMVVGFSMLFIIFSVVDINTVLTKGLLFGVVFFLTLHLWGVRKFLLFCVKEEGALFAFRAFITGLVLYVIILSGAAFSMVPEGWWKRFD